MEVSSSVVWLVVMTVKITRATEGAVPLFACHSGSCGVGVWQEADLRTRCVFTSSVFSSNFWLFLRVINYMSATSFTLGNF